MRILTRVYALRLDNARVKLAEELSNGYGDYDDYLNHISDDWLVKFINVCANRSSMYNDIVRVMYTALSESANRTIKPNDLADCIITTFFNEINDQIPYFGAIEKIRVLDKRLDSFYIEVTYDGDLVPNEADI